MKPPYLHIILFIAVISSSVRSLAYTNVSAAQVHTRLVRGDTLILLDVRESYEYRAGHIAEPAGQAPLTPVHMPYNSRVLAAQYGRLPQDIDVIVYCASGGRSAAAANFLDSKGYTRVFNMTGGFSSWPYETRTGGYGDHSGKWINGKSIQDTITVYAADGQNSSLVFPPRPLSLPDSFYVELHRVEPQWQRPPNLPAVGKDALYQITVLDPFGLAIFAGDSLNLTNEVAITLGPDSGGEDPAFVTELAVWQPALGWQSLPHDFQHGIFHRRESILRRWYFVGYAVANGVAGLNSPNVEDFRLYPNPFHSVLKMDLSPGATVMIFDINGRLVERLQEPFWQPQASVAAGVYFVWMQHQGRSQLQRVLYLR